VVLVRCGLCAPTAVMPHPPPKRGFAGAPPGRRARQQAAGSTAWHLLGCFLQLAPSGQAANGRARSPPGDLGAGVERAVLPLDGGLHHGPADRAEDYARRGVRLVPAGPGHALEVLRGARQQQPVDAVADRAVGRARPGQRACGGGRGGLGRAPRARCRKPRLAPAGGVARPGRPGRLGGELVEMRVGGWEGGGAWCCAGLHLECSCWGALVPAMLLSMQRSLGGPTHLSSGLELSSVQRMTITCSSSSPTPPGRTHSQRHVAGRWGGRAAA
jgi:hypothetical protein